jgi:hypothetical protein
MIWGHDDLVVIKKLLSGRPDKFVVPHDPNLEFSVITQLSAQSRCSDLRTVEGAATGGPGGTRINTPPGTTIDQTLHLLPPIAVTATTTTP